MNQIYWTGEGQVWRNLTITDNGGEWILSFRDAIPSYLKDREVRVTRAITLEQAIQQTIKEDMEYHDELTLHADEG